MNAEDAFFPTQDRSHFFASSVANVVLAQLQQGLDHERPIIVLMGEADVGKASVVREACARWGPRVRAEWLAEPELPADELLPTIVQLFGSTARGDDSRSGWLAALSRSLGLASEQDQTPLLIVEDAHTLPTATLVELAEIHKEVTRANRTLRVILLGVPGFATRLDDLAVDALTQLVSVRLQLGPLPVQDVRHYLHHRIATAGGDGERVFSRKGARELHAASRGVPGRLDRLAIESIRAARDAGTATVGQEHVRTAVTALKNAPAVPATAPRPAKAPARAKAAPEAGSENASASPKVAKPAVERRVAKPARPASAAPATKPAPAAPPPPPKQSPLDSRHPRVKEWVSRFTEDDIPMRFGIRSQPPPITDPDQLPVFDGPEFGAELAQVPARKPARAPEPVEPATFEREPESEPEPMAYTPHPSEPEPVVIENDRSVLEPEPIAFQPEPEPPTAPRAAAAPAAPEARPTPPAPRPDDTPRTQTHDDTHGKRSKRRKRERERAAAAGLAETQSARRDEPVRAPDREPAPQVTEASSVLAASPAPATGRRVIIDQSVNEEPPAITVTPTPPPARKGNGARPSERGRFMHVVVPGVLMLGVAAAAIIAGTRGGFDHEPQNPPTQASSASQLTPAPAPSTNGLPAPAQPDSQAPNSAAPSNSPAPSTTLSTRSPAPPSTTSAASPSASKPTAAQAHPAPPSDPTPKAQPYNPAPAHYCLAVGTYLYSDRARIMARQLSKRTGLEAWVETVESNGSHNFRVLIGGFATDAEAEKAADRMLGKGLVSEATVHPLPADHKGR